MVWAKFDDQYDVNRKVAALTDPAYRLDSSGINWCNRNLTDGLIPPRDLPNIRAQLRDPRKYAGELVAVRRWHALPLAPGDCDHEKCVELAAGQTEGWLIHDFLEYNPSKKKVEEERRKAADRQRRAREARSQRESQGQSRRDTAVTHIAPDPTRPDPAANAAAAYAPPPPSPGNPTEPVDADGLPPLVAILRARLDRAGLVVRWDKLSDHEVQEIGELVIRHGGDATLIDAARKAWRPNDPAVFAAAWLTMWRTLPTTAERLRVVPPAYCDQPGHEHETVPCKACAADLKVGDR